MKSIKVVCMRTALFLCLVCLSMWIDGKEIPLIFAVCLLGFSLI